MASDEEEDAPQSLHFSLHLDKALPSQVEIAAWNPDKDLLAMVSVDHQLTVHRFNWQRLWAISPAKRVTSICWSPDGKALAAGYEDGEICIHDVENGETLRSLETHKASVQCLHWAEEKASQTQDLALLQEDRTPKFFPPHPRPPAMPGAGSAFDIAGGLGGRDENSRENASSKHFQQHLNILCSADSDGFVSLSAFGMFSVGKLELKRNVASADRQLSAVKMMLCSDLRFMTLLCTDRGKDDGESEVVAIIVDTTLISSRRNEIRLVALQAAAVEELLVVLHSTLTVMKKHWSDAISSFTEKFTGFQELLSQHGRDSTPRDELLCLLACGAVSGSLHQFLAISLGEPGLKKLSKSIDAAGRELLTLIADYLQPSAEIVAFRISELLGLARWRSQLESIGLDEALVDTVMENAGMLLVQVERFLQLVSQTTGQFRLFFLWLTKALRQFNSDSVIPDQASAINSADIANFLQSQFETDPIGPHVSSEGVMLETSLEDQGLAEELLGLGGFKDVKFLQRTLFQQLEALCASWRTALSKPIAVISPALAFTNRVSLCQSRSKPSPALSSAYYEMPRRESSELPTVFIDYTCFQMGAKHIGVARGLGLPPQECDGPELAQMIDDWGSEVALLQLDDHLQCVDFALYKEKQLVLLLDDQDQAWIMVLQLEDLQFTRLSDTTSTTSLIEFCTSNDAVSMVDATRGKARSIAQLEVIPPLAVSASRGLACVFSAQKRALLYDLEEEEERDTPNDPIS